MNPRRIFLPHFSWHLLIFILAFCNGFPTIEKPIQQQNNYEQTLDKTRFRRPELEDTIEAVQRILAHDPSLPRLTRGEIEELYEKVAREEYEKSVEAGDMGRADSMRALMLVLPYNTDNNTEENLQELYTRPPVTKVIDGYTPVQPIKFLTPGLDAVVKTETADIGNIKATTYKPAYAFKTGQLVPGPTTYHPPQPPAMFQVNPSSTHAVMDFQPITNRPLAYEYAAVEPFTAPKKGQRYSSHYSAKDSNFLQPMQRRRKRPSTTVKPVADVLATLGIVGQLQKQQRFKTDDHFAAESAPQAVIASYVPQAVSAAELKTLRSESSSAKIRPEAYASFKPLNIGEEMRIKPEVESYLTRFGIVGGRKRKALKKNHTNKTENSEEQTSEESELSVKTVTNDAEAKTKAKKSAPAAGNDELAKLLDNLQQLERLNLSTAKIALTTPKSIIATSTTPKTTIATSTAATLATENVPALTEPKKPRRRIDPALDINYGAAGNQQSLPSTNDDQLAKLLENLQELEKLRINPENVIKSVRTTLKPTTSTSTVPTTVKAQTIANRFSADFATLQGQQMKNVQLNDLQQLQRVLKELQAHEQSHKKRITTQAPSLSSGLRELDEIQKLLSDNRALELAYDQARAKKVTTSTTTVEPISAPNELAQLQDYLNGLERKRLAQSPKLQTTTKPTQAPTARESDQTLKSSQVTGLRSGLKELEELQKLLSDERALERAFNEARKKVTATTNQGQDVAVAAASDQNGQSHRSRAAAQPPRLRGGLTELEEIQKLLNDNRALERAYDEARAKKVKPTTSSTTTTTLEPKTAVNELAQLQEYLSELDRKRLSSAQKTQTTSKPTQPPPSAFAHGQNVATGASSDDRNQLTQLLNRVQELERKAVDVKPLRSTETPFPFLGFTSRNINSVASKPTANEYNVDNNDFAQLQQLYRQMNLAEQNSFGKVEISTAATASKQLHSKRTQDFAQRIIDITNDTGSTLRDVEPNDFVQLQKLLSKVNELERVKIKPELPTSPHSKSQREVTTAANTDNAVPSHNIREAVQTRQVYPVNTDESRTYQEVKDLLLQSDTKQELVLDLPSYRNVAQNQKENSTEPHAGPNSIVSKKSASVEELDKYQNAFNEPENNERDSYKQLKPPMIYKTVVKDPPRFIATRRPQDVARKAEDLEELQKLLNNAQELEKLGIKLPNDLSKQIENKLTSSSSPQAAVQKTKSKPQLEGDTNIVATTKTKPTTEKATEQPEEKTVVFSLTTMKSLLPKEPKPQISSQEESVLELPIFSATKIIEDAIKRAANQIGVGTEKSKGFRRAGVGDMDDMAGGDDDLMAEFTELNYQLAMPEAERRIDVTVEAETDAPDYALMNGGEAQVNGAEAPESGAEAPESGAEAPESGAEAQESGSEAPENDSDAPVMGAHAPVNGSAAPTKDIRELQRLINNLNELEKLNISIPAEALRQADKKYFESLNSQTAFDDDATNKLRRQSPNASTGFNPTAAPTRVNLGLNFDNAENGSTNLQQTATTAAPSTTTTTEESRNGAFSDLEDSFGGPDPNKQEPLPPKKKNGFYFLADWNSFLEVGTGPEQVVVRFSPKIGDPRDFLQVKIP